MIFILWRISWLCFGALFAICHPRSVFALSYRNRFHNSRIGWEHFSFQILAWQHTVLKKQVAMLIQSSSNGDDLAPLDEMATKDTSPKTCSVCFAIAGVVTTLFTPPDLDWCPDDSFETAAKQEGRRDLSPRKVCQLWKTKRKEERRKLQALRQQSQQSLFREDHEFQSETKQNAQQIQRNYEKRFDQNDYSQIHEKYGSRADFIRDKNTWVWS